jgi:hypothetical protein
MIIGLIIFVLAISASLAWLWAGGITYMKENHPDYKGNDFLDFDFDEEDKNEIL